MNQGAQECVHFRKGSSVKINGSNVSYHRQAEPDEESQTYKLNGSDAVEEKEGEGGERASWGRKAEFICSCLGYAVGLGNLWRFPYLCYSNGGGAFLLPYGIMLLFVGMPVFFLELTLGQYASQGCVGVWKCCPLFKGLGYGMVSLSGLISIYYNVIMCWAVFYFVASFTDMPSLPWVGCNNYWNTVNCFDDRDINATLPGNGSNISVVSASEEYYSKYVLNTSSGIEETGSLRWHLTLCLLFAWTFGFCALVRGVKSIGKVVYFTAIFPYVVLIILFFRGVTLPGAGEGIKFYMQADWSALKNARVWKDAAAQIFFSLSAANGGLHVVSSYNKFKNNVYMDAIIIPLLNCGTSVFAGFAIFAILGFMAHETGKEVSEVASSGVGLAFIAYPEALSRMPGAPFWAILFFLMLITLGLGSLVVLVETIITSIRDDFPIVTKWIKGHSWLLPFAVCLLLFILGLPHVTEGGLYWLVLQDAYAAALSMLILGLTELLVITYLYGYRNLLSNLYDMIGKGTQTFRFMVFATVIVPMFIAPFLVMFVLIYYIYDYKPLTVGDYTYPRWAEPGLAWMMTLGSSGLIIVYMPYHLIYKEEGTFFERLKNSVKPRKDWGPLKDVDRKSRDTGYDQLEPAEQETQLETLKQGLEHKNLDAVRNGPDFSYTLQNQSFDDSCGDGAGVGDGAGAEIPPPTYGQVQSGMYDQNGEKFRFGEVTPSHCETGLSQDQRIDVDGDSDPDRETKV